MEYSRYSEEQIKEAADISIYEYVKAHGYNSEKAGREIHIKGYGGLYVNPVENSFFNHSEGKGGHGCISFLQYMEGMSFKQAMEALVGDGAMKYEKREWTQIKKDKPTEFVAPKKAEKSKLVYDENVGVRVSVAKNRNLPISELKVLAKDNFLKVRLAAQETLDFLSLSRNSNGSNDREIKDDEEDKEGDSFIDKIENANRVADKIAAAIDGGELDRNEHSVGQEQ